VSSTPLPGLEAAPGHSWVLVLPYLPKSMNEREGLLWAKQGWAVKKETREIYADVADAVRSAGVPEAFCRRVVQVTFQKTSRGQLDDPGNLWSRTKALLDGLVKAGALIDDNDRWLELPRPLQTKGPEKATIIAISDAAPIGPQAVPG
jgi:hypothetical protein